MKKLTIIFLFTTFFVANIFAQENFNCGETFTDPRNGQTYNSVQIGDQCWMAENLNIGTMINGTEEMTDNSIIEKYCYDNDPANCEIYGGLYQWNEMMQYTTAQGVQSICPDGWKIPTDDEWKILEGAVDSQYSVGDPIWNNTNWRGYDVGLKLKSTNGWYSNGNGSDAYGFTVLPGGFRGYSGSFSSVETNAIFWSSTESSTYAYDRGLAYYRDLVSRTNNIIENGFSIRCLKDETIPINLPPEPPSSPNPEDGALNQSIEINLSWTCTDPEGDPLTYDIYFGTEATPTLVSSGQTETTYDPGTLENNTEYFWKIIAHDDHSNTTEGSVWSFTTEEGGGQWQCGDSFTDSRNGQTYNSIQIGEQCWMAENLNIGEMIIGTENMTDNSVIEKYCYDNDPANCEIYGGLYQWNEMMQYTTAQGVQGICPAGWYLPTDGEFSVLSDYLGGWTVAGGKMKEAGTTHWQSPNAGATNESGFTGLPGGLRTTVASFGDLGIIGYFWSSSEQNTADAWIRGLSYSHAEVIRLSGSKYNGLNSRCLQDVTVNLPPEPPSSPNPEDGAVNQSIEVNLSWTCTDPEGDPLTYDIYLGTEAIPTLVISSQTETTYDPGTLENNTEYFWKIIAHDDHSNTTEGTIWSFITEEGGGQWQCGDPFIDPRNGQTYNSVQIGDQCWMVENLNIGEMINGTEIMTNNGVIEKYCYDNDPANCEEYGGLYQWNEMMQYTTAQGVQGICPSGWYIPTDDEWKILEGTVDSQYPVGDPIWDYDGWRGYDAGLNLKSTSGWYSNGNGTDLYGFTTLPSGMRYNGNFVGIENYTFLWTSSPSGTFAWRRHMQYDHNNTGRYNDSKENAFAVRCLKDETTPTNQPPEPPSSPNPEDGVGNQSIEVNLLWTCTDPEGDPLTYDIYFGTEVIPTLVISGQTETTYNPGILGNNTEYFWKIVAHDDHSNTTEGIVWSFSTEEVIQFYSTSAGGPWDSTWTWVAGVVPEIYDNVVLQGPVHTSGNSCKSLTLTPNGALNNTNSTATLIVSTYVNNEGTISDGSNSYLYVHAKGDITQAGEWNNHTTYLSGTSEQHISCGIENSFSGAYFHSNNNTNIIADTDVEFIGTQIDLNNENIVLQEGNTLTLTGGNLRNGTVAANNAVLNMTDDAYLYNVDIENAELQGTCEIYSNEVVFNGTTTVTGVLQNKSGWYYTLTINGDFINNGTIQNNGSDALYVDISGNIINNGIWQNYDIELIGTSDQHISCLNGNAFTGTYFFGNSSRGNIYFDTDIEFVGTHIDLNNDNLILAVGTTLSLSGGNLRNGTVAADNAVLNMTDDAYLYNVDIENAELQGNCDIMSNAVSFSGTTTVTGNLRSRNSYQNWATITLNGDIINNGTISNYGSNANLHIDIPVDINITNNGIWQNYDIELTGTSDQHISCPGDSLFAISYFYGNSSRGNIYFDTDIEFVGTALDLNSDNLILQEGNTLTLTGGRLDDGTVTANNAVLNMTDDAYMQNVDIENVELQGTCQIYSNVVFNGTTTVTGILQNKHSYSSTFTLIVNGDIVNNGTIRNGSTSSSLAIDFLGDMENNGIWQNHNIEPTGTSNQNISCSTGNTFAITYFYGNTFGGNVTFTSDVEFVGTALDLNEGNLFLQEGNLLTLTGGRIFNGSLTANNAVLNMMNDAYLYDVVIENAELQGVCQVNSNVVFNGTTTVTGFLQNKHSYNSTFTSTVNGDIVNNGTIRNGSSSSNLAINITGDIENNGSWYNYRTLLNGTNDQTISLQNSNYLTGDVRFISDITGTSYQWNFNSAPLNSPDFAGETSVELDWNVPVSGDYVGIFNCDATGKTLSRNIIVTESILANFEATPLAGITPLNVQFTDLSIGEIIAWQWDFDNNGTIDSEEQNPEWIYNEPGIYSVSLTVSDGTNEDTETKTDYIVVEEQVEQPYGSGTEADPYQIATLDNLLWVSTNSGSWSSGTYFIQTANIDATDTQNWNGGQGFSPIGNNPTFFEGNYDGQNYGINGLYINRPTEYDQGLFGYSGGYIENVTLTNVNVTGFDGVGALVGFSSVTSIINCSSSGYVTGTENRIGGLAGESNGGWTQGYVTDCHSSCHVTGVDNVGGLVGQSSRSTISYCSGSGSVSGSEKVGGLAGWSVSSSTITNSFSTGSVSGSSNNIGGLAGSCNVTAVNNCYSRSSVNGVSHVAGLVGYAGETNIWNCYSTGVVVGTGSYVGGLVGEIYWFASCENSFWDYETSGIMSSPYGGTGKTTAEMQDVATFTNEATAGLSSAWDFVGNPNGDTGNDDYWDIDGYNNQGYPYLSYQFTSPLQADFSASNTTISLGYNIHFTDLSTGTPSSWEWDFQNDGVIDSYDQNPDWIYTVSGIYTVSLRVSDGIYYNFSNKNDYIIVVDCNPTMAFSPNPLDFGVNEIAPEQDTLLSWLKNTSNCELFINSLFGLQPPYSYDTTNLSLASILPGDSLEIPVILNKDFAVGTYTDTLIIANSASPNFDFEDGLVAWYPFNGNANDESGNGHNGQISGDPQSGNDRFGNNNSAYDFDGNGDFITAGNWFTYQDFTISVWVKQDAINSTYVDIIDNNHSSVNWAIQYDGNSEDYYFFTNPQGATAFTLPFNEWKNLVFIKDGLSLKTYMNGILQDELTATTPTINYSNPYLNIARWGGGDRYFNGKIDDIRMYDRGLTEDEVEALYNENNGIEGYPQLIIHAELEYPVLIADFEADNVNVNLGEEIQFTDLSTSNPASWQWDFDNNGTIDSEDQNPEWIYNEPGIYTVSLTVSDGTNEDTETKEDYITVTSSGGEQQIELPAGYSFVSTRIISENADFLTLCDDILPNLDFVRNTAGNMLRKIGPMWINGIGNWITTEGYLFRMNNADELIMTGDVIDPETPIALELGYQFISYLPENSIDALTVFNDVLDNLDFVRNTGGLMLRKIGPMWINGIGDLNPGEGYLVKMLDSDVLIYPSTSSSCGEPFIDIRDGKTYNTVQIGEQCWMAENLNIGEMINGTEEMADNGVIEKYCYENNNSNCDEYGGLYQWDEMMQYTISSGVQGICPEGWYIPTDDEWKILEGTVDSQYPVGDPIWNNYGSRGYDAGLNLKSTTGWYPNCNGTDLFGFTALPGGYRYHLGDFYNLEASADFWSSTENNTTAWSRLLYYNSNEVTRGNPMKSGGRSVRCLQDNSRFDNLSIKDKNYTNDLSNPKIANIKPVHFVFEGGNAADPVYTIYIKGLDIGDEIAAYDGGIMVGVMKANSQNAFENELAVFSTVYNGQGYQSGNPIILKIFDNSTQSIVETEYTLENVFGEAYMQKTYPSEDGFFSVINITKSSGSLIEETLSVYPNPASDLLNINSNNQILRVKILNYTGQIVSDNKFNNKELIINTSVYNSGIYFIQIETEKGISTKKVIIE